MARLIPWSKMKTVLMAISIRRAFGRGKITHCFGHIVRADKKRKAQHDRSHDTDNLVGKRDEFEKELV
jgi:hypothetical protein